MFIEDLRTKAPKVNFEYNINPEDHYTTCPCGKFVAYSYINCPACGKLIVRKAKPEVGELPVEPHTEVVVPETPEVAPITETEQFVAPEVVAADNLVKPKRGHRKE